MPLVTAVFCRTQRNTYLEERYLRYIDASAFYLLMRTSARKTSAFAISGFSSPFTTSI